MNGDSLNHAAGRHRLLLALVGLGILAAALGTHWALTAGDDQAKAHFNTMPSVTLLPAEAKPETYRVTGDAVAVAPLTP